VNNPATNLPANVAHIAGDTVQIELLGAKRPDGSAYVAVIDVNDYERVKGFRWRVASVGKHRLYAKMAANIGRGRNVTCLLHRCVVNAPDGSMVLAVNGNYFDCTRRNLKIVERAAGLSFPIVKRVPVTALPATVPVSRGVPVAPTPRAA
jgi:hypothetical protein